MLRRYAVAAVALCLWAASALPTWLADPLSPRATVGHPAVGGPLVAVAVGFVLVGTLYHVVPFLVWVDQYSHQLGLADVPSVDDLYDSRLARVDLAASVGGALLVLVAAVRQSDVLVGVGGLLVVTGLAVATVTLLDVVRRHAATGLAGVLVPEGARPTVRSGRRTGDPGESEG
jgi:hypothetical protein